ncbi:MAG: hypothetical protein COB37_00570 [Kordiimonadales bacterium]|nr:MAG: hypothetical protein COB37_00570 [Kordiimonadales bacterium]
MVAKTLQVEQRTNRASGLFRIALENVRLSLKPALEQEPACFSYLIGDDELKSSDNYRNGRLIRIVEKRTRNKLANKATLAHMLRDSGVRGLFPPTYVKIETALECPRGRYQNWFIKNRYGTGGRGMRVVSDDALEAVTLEKHEIIQAGVNNIALLDGRKFTTRIYVLIWNQTVFLFDRAFVVIHSKPFEAGSCDFKIQIDHAGYEKEASTIDMAPLSWREDADQRIREVAAAIRQLLPVLEESRAATDQDTFLMLGIDALMLEGKGVKLIEINAAPNFVHTDEINEDVNIPFFEACLKRMFYQPVGSLIEIKP